MKQLRSLVIGSGTGPSSSAVRFLDWQCTSWAIFESTTHGYWGAAGTIFNPGYRMTTPPGAGKSWTFQVRNNGADVVGATWTISDTSTYGYYAGSFSVVDGDFLDLKVTPSGTPAGMGNQCFFYEFTSSTAGMSAYQDAAVNLNAASTAYRGVFASTAAGWDTTAGNLQDVCPTPGNLSGYSVYLYGGAPGAGKSYTFNVYLNGVIQDGTAGSVNTTGVISDAAVSVVKNFTLPLVAGDYVYFGCTPAGTPTVRPSEITHRFTATDTNAFIMAVHDQGTEATTGSPHYHTGNNGWNDGFSGWALTSDASFGPLSTFGPTSVTLQKMYVRILVAPGAGKSRVYTLRVDGAAPAETATVTISGASQVTASDVVGRASGVGPSYFCIEDVESGTPAASRWNCAFEASNYAGPAGSCVMNGFSTTDNHMAARGDMLSAMRQYLQCLYCTSNPDIAPLTERYRKAHTATDCSDVWNALRDAAYGLETS